jgi:HK97 family phage prohead protease
MVGEAVKRGDLTGSSFSFEIEEEEYYEEQGRTIRELRSVRLYDVGPVTYPAYEATNVGLTMGANSKLPDYIASRLRVLDIERQLYSSKTRK